MMRPELVEGGLPGVRHAQPTFLTSDRVVRVEEVFGVVALLNLAKALEDLRREFGLCRSSPQRS
jgi:hypothetical protein